MKNQMQTSRQSLLAGLGLALPLFAAGAYAQSDGSEVFVLDPFSVVADEGYAASNSIAGTRTNTAIKDIPLNIHVFTKDLADDLMLTSQVDLERYNASMINGGADAHSSNAIQQSYNNFIFRGFRQNWSMRDGVRQYDPVDSQGFDRVEVVKGPAAALYGLTYPGGVMNLVSKSALLDAQFTDLTYSIASEGEYRATIDANYGAPIGQDGRFAIRFNGVKSRTKDQRENSNGDIEFSQLNFAYAPNQKTKFELLYEDGSRSKTSGLGTFTRGGADGADTPIQALYSNISWDDNWASPNNKRSLDTQMIRAEVTHNVTDDFVVTAYFTDSDRVQVDSDGLNASGMGGSAASWDMGFSSQGANNTGWIVNPDTGDDEIVMAYHHRDWHNANKAFGATGVYSLDTDAMKNTFTFGYNKWEEDFISFKRTQPAGSPNLWRFSVAPNPALLGTAPVPVGNTPNGPPPDYFSDLAGAFGPELNSNEYLFATWQGSLLDDKLKLNLGVNRTEFELVQYPNGLATAPGNVTSDSQVSPMIGVVYAFTPSVSGFLVHSTSLFPTTDKDDFDTQMPAVEGKSYEAGIKFDAAEGKLSGTFSYYEIVQEGGSQRDPTAENRNKQLWDTLSPAERLVRFPGITNRAALTDRDGQLGNLVAGEEATSKGFELDMMYRPIESWQIMFSYAHNDTEISDSVNPANIGNAPYTGLIDDQFALVTKYSFNEGALADSFVGMGFQHAGKAYQGTTPDSGTARFDPATDYLELFAGKNFEINGKKAFVKLNIKNVTEQETFVGWRPLASSGPATERYLVPVDRKINLTFGYSF